jgi:hypothetical protein
MIQASSQFTAANAILRKEPIFLLTIAGYSRAFTNKNTGVYGQFDWIVDIADLANSVSDMDGGADLGQLVVSVQDFQGLITADFPNFVFEGKQVTLSTGFVGMAQANFVTLFTGVIDNVASSNENTSYDFTCTDNTLRLSQVIYTVADNGNATDQDNIRTLNGHPLDILMAIFTNELGLTTADFNQAKIISYRDNYFAGAQFVFLIDSPPAAKDFIEQELMKTLGGYLWTNSLGQLDVNFFSVRPAVISMTLDANNTLGHPDYSIPVASQADLINTMSFRFDKSSSGDFNAERVEEYDVSIAKYGQFGQQVVESQGMRAGLQGYVLGIETSRLIFLRYGLKQLKFDANFNCDWTTCVLEIGDLVAVTNPFIPDRTLGVMGVQAKAFEVLDRSLSFDKGVVTLTLIEFTAFPFSYIAPNGKAPYASASGADRARYMYLCNDTDTYSTGAAAKTLG